MATKSRKSTAAKKSSKRASTTAAKKSAPKKGAARKASARKAAPKKAAAKKAAPQRSTAKKAAPKARKAPPARRRKAAEPRTRPRPDTGAAAPTSERPATGSPFVEQVETTSAGIQPLAPMHAAVDEFTSSGNELLDIFQRYDRNRTGSIERREFARLLEALGQNITDEELEIAIDMVDTERTGKISWQAFKSWWTSR
ncbi:MAG TPA: EF-hand domain-containing protein [Myxococcus sp.]|nr:EF-hand domain-containing protein [Myxococcus sp.]